MITVYKYSLENWRKNVCRVILPIGAEILKYQYSAYTKGEELNIWAKVDTAAAEEVCYFYIVKTGENITKRLEQRDKNKELKYIGSFVDKNDSHWHIFKAAAAYTNISTVGHYWDGSIQPFTTKTTTTPNWSTLCGSTANNITVSGCCDNDSEGSITLTNCDSALTINKNDIDINAVAD